MNQGPKFRDLPRALNPELARRPVDSLHRDSAENAGAQSDSNPSVKDLDVFQRRVPGFNPPFS